MVEKIEGQQAIVNLLGLSPSLVTSAPVISYEPSLVFQLASPVNMTIDGPGGWQIGEGVTGNIPDATYSSVDNLAIIPEPLGGNYEIQITPVGLGGKYRLLVGFITENGDYWEEFTGTATVDSVNTHELWVPDSNQTPTFILLHQAKTQTFNLKKFFNKEKIPPKLKGQIENELAKIMARINAALDLLGEGKPDKSQEKINQAIEIINNLQNYINSSTLPQATQDLLLEPLQEIENFLNQALD